MTALRASPDRIHVACGYADGSIRVYHLLNGLSGGNRPEFQLDLHRSAVNVLRYDASGLQLVTGGQDTDVCVVDTVEQVGKSRLVGHSGAITDAHFYEALDGIVITASKDTRIKFWNVQTQSCFRTVCDHRGDVWALALLRNSRYMVSGSAESTLNVYELKVREENTDIASSAIAAADADGEDEDNMAGQLSGPVECKLTGTIMRGGKGRTVSLVADTTGSLLGCHGTDDHIDVFYFCTEEEALQRLTKRIKKLAVTATPTTVADQPSSNDEQQQTDEAATTAAAAAARALSLSDEVRRLAGIRTQSKIKSIDLLLNAGGDELRIACTFAKNFVRLYSLAVRQRGAEAQLLRSLTQHGHHSEVRALAFSSDSLALATGSGESVKIWNRESMRCLRTVEDVGYVLSACFVPGDRHVLLGLKTGGLLIVDVVVGQVLEEIAAHQAECWSVGLLPDQKGCVTGGGDCTVKVWTFELIAADATIDGDDVTKPATDQGAKVLSLLHKNTLKLEETVFCVKVSPNGKFIAVGLINSTVQIFFMDTFKFYLSLYGHKLPVLCLDISDDSAIIATGSADRNVKIWGMDFGDCHRSLFAHDDSVMSLQFVPHSHQFWTCGKDGKIKQWDGDSFVKIITLPDGHLGEAYALAVDASGHYLASCGSDRVVRVFRRTQETLVLRDVQEEEREQQEQRTLATGEETTVAGLPGLKMASRKTVGAEKAAESLIECFEVCREFEANESQEVPPLMRAYGVTNSNDYLMAVLERVRPNDLEEALLLLPFDTVVELLQSIPPMTKQRKDRTELICKCVLFLMRIHQKPIVANQTLLPVLQSIIGTLRSAVVEQRDIIGENNHALQMLQRDCEARDGVELFRDASKAKKKTDKRNKKRQLTKRLHVQMN